MFLFSSLGTKISKRRAGMAQGGAGWGVGAVQMPRQGRVLDHQGSMGGHALAQK